MIKIVYPIFPPSSNKIYFRGTSLTRPAREYGETFAKYVAQHHGAEVAQLDPSALYAVHLHFYFPTVENGSWNNLDVRPSKRAKTRYKKFDLDNRIKFLTDCIRDAIDIDDSQFFAGSQEKHQDPAMPRIEIFVHPVEPSLFGVRPR